MRKRLRLKTQDGTKVFVHLDNWGVGIDRMFRRWTREPDGWLCVDTGQIARRAGLFDGLKKTQPRWKD
jgi:hypothetical protein